VELTLATTTGTVHVADGRDLLVLTERRVQRWEVSAAYAEKVRPTSQWTDNNIAEPR